jgi:Zn finger protein HypA/HybF involved in hydrogenase expression
MATIECARCHRYFEKVAFEAVCPRCFPIEEQEFARIKEYLSLHPGASTNEVMRDLNVDLKSIKRYLKEERLEIVGDNKGFIKCELCGKAINSGRFCDGCYKEGQALRHKEEGAVKSAYIKSAEHTTKGIRFRDNKDKKG